ncbi:hypothetical protein [Massilia sp. 9I]|uniref:hypothetical protein n=1 Tax=Massilia sp. 9I TaxID=2653152 RepID=UPI0012F2D667|nr:hypothetical protein [Massilia sp. 9I]VXC71361.1 conserved hypothetical protein [Massilia sp. 9I]
MTTHIPDLPQPARSNRWFDPHTAFLDLKIVRRTVTGIVLLMAIAAICILVNDRLIFDLSSDGLNTAATLFKVPIGIGTLSIPALALLAANHRSEQTRQQMALTLDQIKRTDLQINIAQGQNIFSNYFKHFEEFENRYQKKEGVFDAAYVKDTHKAHRNIFPAARRGDLSVGKDFLHFFTERTRVFLQLCKGYGSFDSWEATSYSITLLISELKRHFHIERRLIGSEVTSSGYNFVLPGGSVVSSLIYYQEIFAYMDEILSFDPDYVTPQEVKRFLEIDLEDLRAPNYNNSMHQPFDAEIFA